MAWCNGSGQQQPQVNNTQQVWPCCVFFHGNTAFFRLYSNLDDLGNDKMQAIRMVDNQDEMRDGWPRGYWSILRQAAKCLRTC